MARAKLKTKKSTATYKSKSKRAHKSPSARKFKITTRVSKPSHNKIGNIFHFPLGQEKRNFSTTFEYGNVFVNARSKGGDVTVDFKFSGKNFTIAGTVILNEKSFRQLQNMTNQVLANIGK